MYFRTVRGETAKPCQDSQAGSGCSVYPPWLDTALFEQSQLPPKK
jgi:hypothetical protein